MESYRLTDLHTNMRMILKFIPKKYVLGVGTGLQWFTIRPSILPSFLAI
jgi:hypothetical protein